MRPGACGLSPSLPGVALLALFSHLTGTFPAHDPVVNAGATYLAPAAARHGWGRFVARLEGLGGFVAADAEIMRLMLPSPTLRSRPFPQIGYSTEYREYCRRR